MFIPIPLIISGLSALAGALGSRKGAQTSTQNQSSTSSSSYNDEASQDVNLATMPEMDATQQFYRDYILKSLMDRYKSSTDLTGYTTAGLQNINTGAAAQRNALSQILASRGLSYSPAATSAMGRIESGRIGEQVGFLNQIPLLQRQFGNEDINNLANFFRTLPTGQRQTGTTTQRRFGTSGGTSTGTGVNQPAGNVLGGLFSGLGTGLAYTWGRTGGR